MTTTIHHHVLRTRTAGRYLYRGITIKRGDWWKAQSGTIMQGNVVKFTAGSRADLLAQIDAHLNAQKTQ